MTTDFRSTVSVEMGSDNWTRTAFKRDTIRRLETYTEVASGVESVAAGATRAVGFGGIAAAKVIYIEATGAVGVSINGAAVLPLAPSTGQIAYLMLDGASVTSLSFVNSSADSVTVRYAIAGA